MQSSSHCHHKQTNTQFLVFLQAGCPSCHSTDSVRALKKNEKTTCCTNLNMHFCTADFSFTHCTLISVFKLTPSDVHLLTCSNKNPIWQNPDLVRYHMSDMWISSLSENQHNQHLQYIKINHVTELLQPLRGFYTANILHLTVNEFNDM